MNSLFMPKEDNQKDLNLLKFKQFKIPDYDVLVFAKGETLYYYDSNDLSKLGPLMPKLLGSVSSDVFSLEFFQGDLYDSRADGKIVKTLENEVVSLPEDTVPKRLSAYVGEEGEKFLFCYSRSKTLIYEDFGKMPIANCEGHVHVMCFEDKSKLKYITVGGETFEYVKGQGEKKTGMYAGVNDLINFEGEIYAADDRGFVKRWADGADLAVRAGGAKGFCSINLGEGKPMLLDCSSEGIYDTLANSKFLDNTAGAPGVAINAMCGVPKSYLDRWMMPMGGLE